MDPEFFRKLQSRPDEIKSRRLAADVQADRFVTDAARIAADEQKTRENRHRETIAYLRGEWNNTPVIHRKLESLRAAIGGGKTIETMSPLSKYNEEVHISYGIPFQSRRGRRAIQIGTKIVFSSGEGGMGASAPRSGEIPTYQLSAVETLYDQVGVQIYVSSENAHRNCNLRFYSGAWLKLDPHTVKHKYDVSVFLGGPVFDYSVFYLGGDLPLNDIAEPFEQRLEKNIMELQDVYLRVTGQI